MKTDLQLDPAIMFPGMGPSDFAGLAKFMLINPVARGLMAGADDVLGYSLFDRYRDSVGDYTEHAQVAFMVNCLALARWAEQELGIRPEVCVGPSFGGKVAAVYSGALTFEEGVLMVLRCARALEEHTARDHRDLVTQSFARTPQERLDGILRELDERGEWYDLSCHVDDDFHMLTLERGRLDWLTGRLRAAGGMPLYTMHPPMHTRALAPLRDEVEREVFGGLRFADPRIPVVADQDGRLLDTGEGVREMLLDGFVEPVRWPRAVAGLRRLNVRRLYVSGPDALFGRVRCTTSSFEVVPVTPRVALRPRSLRAAG
ncbi:ACP S-malonyltransferase [Planomonospora sp. ID91781]|uniref:[acyl-carrier-protein] S-malonyltransferase n=3 Tax=Planomonospora TaxID=1998 RepID=A0A171DQC4_9ACTN|nr:MULTISPECIES: ACP S-malonyltransferase [Planomonospora]MBG0825000.1 ACP S-malonyltransferase [Planomonospora sp. ID91781]GAT71264.1 ACP S-malonyltransferase [Planomonospora sphaerica]GGK97924.1 malonyl CoA-acyl carrier protein transacylase [Planomonospora parontospora]GII12824.1 malonyl CoA-acyl carrier protein transacylase [Planomonospora parontospora subsp. parontospora]